MILDQNRTQVELFEIVVQVGNKKDKNKNRHLATQILQLLTDAQCVTSFFERVSPHICFLLELRVVGDQGQRCHYEHPERE